MDFIIISVGNELLSGDIVNTNSAYIANKLTRSGHNVIKMLTIPDVVDVIAQEVVDASQKADHVIVTGGLGVTHDDVTAEGVAKATNRELKVNDEVFSFLRARMKNETAIKSMATIPEGSEVVNNVVGAAPGFMVDNISVMPGVPEEMKYILDKFLPKYGSYNYFEERMVVKGHEDKIMESLNSVVDEFEDVEIGSYPKPGYIMIKFSGKDEKRVKAAKEKLEDLIKQ
ncbi:MAG: competence/damage-inducible protein A [Archaeoglobaceae archaeon]